MTSPDTMPVPQTAAESIAQCREQGLAEPEKVARESWPELFSEHSKPTPGVWELSEARGSDGEHLVVGGAGQSFGLIAAVTLMGDARLIAEAGTVYHETGCSPRELQKQRDELRESTARLIAYVKDLERAMGANGLDVIDPEGDMEFARATMASVEGGVE